MSDTSTGPAGGGAHRPAVGPPVHRLRGGRAPPGGSTPPRRRGDRRPGAVRDAPAVGALSRTRRARPSGAGRVDAVVRRRAPGDVADDAAGGVAEPDGAGASAARRPRPPGRRRRRDSATPTTATRPADGPVELRRATTGRVRRRAGRRRAGDDAGPKPCRRRGAPTVGAADGRPSGPGSATPAPPGRRWPRSAPGRR